MNAIIRWLAATLFPIIKPLIFRAIGLAGDQTRSLLSEIYQLKFLSLTNDQRQIYAEYTLARNLGWVHAQPPDYTNGLTEFHTGETAALPQLQQQFLRKAVKLAYYLSDLSYWLGFAAKQPAAVSEAPSTRGPLPPTPEL